MKVSGLGSWLLSMRKVGPGSLSNSLLGRVAAVWAHNNPGSKRDGRNRVICLRIPPRDTKFPREGGETLVGCPQLQAPNNRRGKQVNVDPAEAPSVEVSRTRERYHIAVRNETGLVHFL